MSRALGIISWVLIALLILRPDLAAQGAGGSAPDSEAFLTTLGALGQVVLLSMMIERALALAFDLQLLSRVLAVWSGQGSFADQKARAKAVPPTPLDPSSGVGGALKALVALSLSLWICYQIHFDALGTIFEVGESDLGKILTAAVVAGGSAGAMSLFQGFLGMSKEARDARTDQATARAAVAKSEKDIAEAGAAVKVAEANAKVAEEEAKAAEKTAAATIKTAEADILAAEAKEKTAEADILAAEAKEKIAETERAAAEAANPPGPG